jgi:hypothetical protein
MRAASRCSDRAARSVACDAPLRSARESPGLSARGRAVVKAVARAACSLGTAGANDNPAKAIAESTHVLTIAHLSRGAVPSTRHAQLHTCMMPAYSYVRSYREGGCPHDDAAAFSSRATEDGMRARGTFPWNRDERTTALTTTTFAFTLDTSSGASIRNRRVQGEGRNLPAFSARRPARQTIAVAV